MYVITVPRDDLGIPRWLMHTYKVIYFVLYDELSLDLIIPF